METSITKKHKLSASDDAQNLLTVNDQEGDLITSAAMSKRSRHQTSTDHDICCQALHIVLQHWLVPDLDFLINDYIEQNTLSDLREKIVNSTDDETIQQEQSTTTPSGTTTQQRSKREAVDHLKLHWIDSFDMSIIQEKLTSLEAENITQIIADNESTDFRRVNFKEQADTLNRLHEKHWINVSYRSEYFTLNCLLDLRDAYLNLHKTLCSFVERQQRQYCRSSSLVVYQLFTIRKWKDTIERTIQKTLIVFSLISSIFHRERIEFKEYNYMKRLQGSIGFSRRINMLFERVGGNLRLLKESHIYDRYIELLDATHGINSLLGSIPRQVNSTLNTMHNSETFQRRLYAIQVNIRRLYSKGIVKVFDEALQQCCDLCAAVNGDSDLLSREMMSFEATLTSTDAQMNLLQLQIKESCQLNWILCMTSTVSSLSNRKISLPKGDLDTNHVMETPIFQWFGGPYYMLETCNRAQYTIWTKIYQRRYGRIRTPLTAVEEELIQEFHKWFEIAMKYCWESVSITKELLITNTYDQSELLHNVSKLLLNEKIYFMEELVRSLEAFSDSLELYLSVDGTNNTTQPNVLLKSYHRSFLNYAHQAIQNMDGLLVLLRSSSPSNVTIISLLSKFINRHPNRNHTMFFYRKAMNDRITDLLTSISLTNTEELEVYSRCCLLETFHIILFSRREDEETLTLQEHNACDYILSIICNISRHLIQLEHKRCMKPESQSSTNSITTDGSINPVRRSQAQQEKANGESSFNHELLTIGYYTLLKYIRDCIDVVNERKSPTISSRLTWQLSQEILSHEIRLLVTKLRNSSQALSTRTHVSSTSSNESKGDNDVLLFRKRLALVAFTSIVHEILTLKPEVFEQRLIKAEDIYDQNTKEGNTIEYTEFLRLVFEGSNIDRHENNLLSTLESLVEDNASLSTKLVSRSNSEIFSIEGIRKWEYVSESVYWKGKVLLKDLLLLEVQAVLKKQYRIPRGKYEGNDDDDDGGDDKQDDDNNGIANNEGTHMEIEHSESGPMDNLNQAANPPIATSHSEETSQSRLASRQQLFQNECNRYAAALQFIEDNHLRIVALDSASIDSLDAEKFVSVSNEILTDTNQINLCKELSDELVHASVDQAFNDLIKELYQRQELR